MFKSIDPVSQIKVGKKVSFGIKVCSFERCKHLAKIHITSVKVK